MNEIKKLFTVRNAFCSIGILNVIEILQTLPFFPRYEANPLFRQHPYILFTYKIMLFVIIIPFFFPKIMEKYRERSSPTARVITSFLCITAIVGNVMFLSVVIWITATGRKNLDSR